ncbi:hypothetical protein [Pseudomonas syringae]|uniref:hypothetical protein n=1 Tax=Pseudomonas syringae TaxID=317 RepID=UPI001F4613AD|nr:hypothetical protein [Pseudomonas syringae]MCF5371974.1 hypothetical protein [Pseudomonas syringae]MCF5382029.1 hypothetical protein [Pseudomonas syringae]MCF5419438.1 hypothetical protein [Pseudomonas syringae]MCF5451984.1 hypothetical protein [Pseudomonas syringae]MCF5456271.1 hypothetical protein [Pseudomonas syringae]
MNPTLPVEELKIAVAESPCIHEKVALHLQVSILRRRDLAEIKNDCLNSAILDEQRKAVGVVPTNL